MNKPKTFIQMNNNDESTEHSAPVSSPLRTWVEPRVIYLSGDKTERRYKLFFFVEEASPFGQLGPS